MDSDRYLEVCAAFKEALARCADARPAFLRELAGRDAELAREVESMLEFDEGDGNDPFDEGRLEGRGLEVAHFAETASGRAEPEAVDGPVQVAGFRIARRLASGGMGVVYLAEQEKPRRPVALKMLRRDAMTPELVRRLRHESEILGRLDHPGIAHIYEAGTVDLGDGAQPYFAMEYVHGRPLTEFVREKGLGVRDRVRLFVSVCDAVEHAHRRGVVHRDLKPDNVLVVDGGAEELGRPKVLDFGVARATESDVELTTMQTGVGQVIGTLPYMSPEQLAGDSSQVDARSDVYSLAALLYELLTDRLPHELRGLSIPQAALRVRSSDPTTLREVDTAYRGDLDTIVMTALSAEPARRYASAAALAADLRRFLGSEPIHARPISRMYRARKFISRHRGLTIGVSAAVLALVVGLVVSLNYSVVAARERAEARRSLYAMTVTTVQAELDAHRSMEAQSRLAGTPEELRDWEFDYLASRLQRHSWRVPCERGARPAHAVLDLRNGRVATRSGLNSVLIFDLRSGEPLAACELPWASVNGELIAAGPDIAVVCGSSEVVLFDWDTAESRSRHRFDDDIRFMLWLEHSEKLVVSTQSATDGGRVTFWELEATGAPRVIATLAGEGARFTSVEEDRFLIADCRTRPGPFVIDLSSSTVLGQVHSPNDGWIQGGGAGTRFTLATTWGRLELAQLVWNGDRTPRAVIEELEAHNLPRICDIQLSADARRMASTAFSVDVSEEFRRGSVRVHDLTTGEVLLEQPTEAHPKCTLSENGRWLAVRDGGQLRVFDLESEMGDVRNVANTFLYEVLFTPDGRTLLVRENGPRIHLWDVLSGSKLGTIEDLPMSGSWPIPWGVTRDGERLVALSVRSSESIFYGLDLAFERSFRRLGGDAEDAGARLATWQGLAGPHETQLVLFNDDFSKNRGASDGGSRSWLTPGEPMPALESVEPEGQSWSRAASANACLSPDGRRIAISVFDVRIHDFETGEWLGNLDSNGSGFYGVDWHPDGTRIATGAREGAVQIWDGETYASIVTLGHHDSYVHDVEWSPDGTILASVGGDGVVRLWDSVPRGIRQLEAREAAARREALRPRIGEWLERGDDLASIAARLRGDSALSAEERSAGLRALYEAVVRARPPHAREGE